MDVKQHHKKRRKKQGEKARNWPHVRRGGRVTVQGSALSCFFHNTQPLSHTHRHTQKITIETDGNRTDVRPLTNLTTPYRWAKLAHNGYRLPSPCFTNYITHLPSLDQSSYLRTQKDCPSCGLQSLPFLARFSLCCVRLAFCPSSSKLNNMIIIGKVFIKHKILSVDYSERIRGRSRARTHIHTQVFVTGRSHEDVRARLCRLTTLFLS